MKVLVLAALLALGGCGTTYQVRSDAHIAAVPADVKKECDPVPEAPARGSDFGALYQFATALVAKYGECALRDQAKANYITSQGH